MKQIQLTDSFSLPLNIVTLRTAIYGTSGSGKTTFARLLAEQVHAAGQRFCAIDLKNDWYGLKSSADGKSAGIPVVIFGGPRRDIQIFPDSGRATAETIVSIARERGASLPRLAPCSRRGRRALSARPGRAIRACEKLP